MLRVFFSDKGGGCLWNRAGPVLKLWGWIIVQTLPAQKHKVRDLKGSWRSLHLKNQADSCKLPVLLHDLRPVWSLDPSSAPLRALVRRLEILWLPVLTDLQIPQEDSSLEVVATSGSHNPLLETASLSGNACFGLVPGVSVAVFGAVWVKSCLLAPNPRSAPSRIGNSPFKQRNTN